MTRRERLERRLERRQEWAASRLRKAADLQARNKPFEGDVAFNTQPGHIPERARAIARTEKAAEHYGVAVHHQDKAAGLERQLERSIFSDDPDAGEALEAKAAALEAKADRCKALNVAFRKAPGADTAAKLAALVGAGTMTAAEAAEAAQLFALCGWERQPFPPYRLTNLRANARRLRERIKDVRYRQEQAAKAEAAPGGVAVESVGPAHDGGEWVRVTFAEKPEREILDTLKAAGFRWGGGSWLGKREALPAAVQS